LSIPPSGCLNDRLPKDRASPLDYLEWPQRTLPADGARKTSWFAGIPERRTSHILVEQHAVQSRTPTMLGVNHLAKLEINLSDFLMRVDIAFYFRGGANVVRTAAGDRVER
jgi:hypothetical protein